ncbi:MAG: ATP-dependent helicase C-terminal domain-containing protein, partial [Vicinamibacterales bacterium]|nr:ATP-dependent helicase C-terminal domain-containing protein [Vicinamibacterales bacterium]
GEGPVLLLQPRRVAARAIARRIAGERGWTLGQEVGWQVRFERRFTADTRLLVVTEGILTARLQQDPLLEGFHTIILDEFHERSLHADLGLALARQAWLARDDLRIVVMSATLDTAQVSAFLGGCPVIAVPGAPHPVTIDYAPGESVAAAVGVLAGEGRSQILCFLPGAREIARAAADLAPMAHAQGIEVAILHGGLDSDAQDAVLRPADHRRVTLATNIAETSLTVPGVSLVIDTGLHKVARYDADRGVDTLTTERVPMDAADQRAGRAGRLGPGRVRRLWDARDRLRPHREPEIARVDLAGPVLEILAWGANPRTFDWFDAPAPDRIDAALALLARLGAIDNEAAPSITALGRRIARLPLHPRLGRLLLAADGAQEAALACALLSEAGRVDPRGVSTSCDLLPLIDTPSRLPGHVQQTARALAHSARETGRTLADGDGDTRLRRAILAAFPDRLARRREPGGDLVTLASGHGGRLARESGVRDGEFLVALDVRGGRRDGHSEALVTLASRVEREWLVPTSRVVEHRFDAEAGVVKAARLDRIDAFVVSEHNVAPDPVEAARLLAEAWKTRTPDARSAVLLARLRFAGLPVDLDDLLITAASSVRRLDQIDLSAALPYAVMQELDRRAPAMLPVPSGRSTPLTYHEDGIVSASVKLQELFGLAETPRIGPGRVPVVFHLLAPNGRPVQTTQDLKSFWARTYPEVRRELRGRYPKHPWPEDPWTATPTHRTTRRPR